mmetsp:Transcript_78472/g.233787  ORF Transcript_78472/g.233787 Transcript_78472/m.233787 type:complete len:219 (-) Transcript_78472:312-968(-)
MVVPSFEKSRMAFSVTLHDVGEQDASMVRSVAAAKSPGSARNLATISSSVGAPKHRSMTATFSSVSTAPVGEGSAPAAASRSASSQAAAAASPVRPGVHFRTRSSRSLGTLAEGTKCVARPARRQSHAVSLEPVMPTYRPTLNPSFSRPSLCVEPTSGKKPMAISGFAKTVLSVATLNGPWLLRPTPPPMVMPSQMLTWQQPVRCRSVARRWTMAYSS